MDKRNSASIVHHLLSCISHQRLHPNSMKILWNVLDEALCSGLTLESSIHDLAEKFT